jgi:hypothetical protein
MPPKPGTPKRPHGAGSLVRRPNNRWKLHYQKENGEYHTETITAETQEHAERELFLRTLPRRRRLLARGRVDTQQQWQELLRELMHTAEAALADAEKNV